MSFRVIEKRDDGTTIAVLDNNTEKQPKKESTYIKNGNKDNIKSHQTISTNKCLKNIENEKRNLIFRPNQKDLKLKNSPEKQSNYINSLQSEQIVNKPTTLSNTLPSEQTNKKLNNITQAIQKIDKTQTNLNSNESNSKQTVKDPKTTQITNNSNRTKTGQTIKKNNFLPTIRPIKNENETSQATKKQDATRANIGSNEKKADQAVNKQDTAQTNIKSNDKKIDQTVNKQNTKQTNAGPSEKEALQTVKKQDTTRPNIESNDKKTDQAANKQDTTQTSSDSNNIKTDQKNGKFNILPTIKLIDLNKTESSNELDEPKPEKTVKEPNTARTESTETQLNTTFSSGKIERNVNPRFSFYRSYSYTKRKLLPPQLLSQENRITLVLDLDETLVHSVFCPTEHCDFSFKTETLHHISVCMRPGAKDFILQVGEFYELVLFTVGNRVYADKIIDFIDPQKMIKYRLYRESCTYSNGNFIKDLSRLGRDLNKVIILDDSPYAYKLQPKNALPISSWVDDPNDNELTRIQTFLIENHNADNVYDILQQYRMKNLQSRHARRKKHAIRKKSIVNKNPDVS